MEEKKRTSEGRVPQKLAVFDPDNLPYEKQNLCTYLRELEEEAEEKEAMDRERRR